LLLVKLQVSLAELTAPVQYIQQLELNPDSTVKVTAVRGRGSVSFLIQLIKAVRVVTLLGGRSVNLLFQFVLSRLILDEESKAVRC